ncbi:unnamed protein product, partial [Effrenium voratum]
RIRNFEDCMETRRAAQQKEVDRLFTELQRSFTKLEGSQRTMLSDTLPEVASAMVQPLRQTVAEYKDHWKEVEKNLGEKDAMLEAELKQLAKNADVGSRAFIKLEEQLRELVSSETDAVLQAVTGRIHQEHEERIVSITAVRRDMKELREKQEEERRVEESTLKTPSTTTPCATPVSRSPARVTRPPFAANGHADTGAKRKAP